MVLSVFRGHGNRKAHGQTIQRSRNVWGPYEMYQADFMQRESEDEAYSILTSRRHENILLQKSGHCDLVETPGGEWYAVHLCGRVSGREMRNPADADRFPGARRYMLGRETAIQKMRWTEDDWLVLDCGGNTPQNEVEMPKEYRTDHEKNSPSSGMILTNRGFIWTISLCGFPWTHAIFP